MSDCNNSTSQNQHHFTFFPLAPRSAALETNSPVSARRRLQLQEKLLRDTLMQLQGVEMQGFNELLSPPQDRKFRYDNSMGRPYENRTRNIWSVTFDISRYGKYQMRISFPAPVTEAAAVEAAEDFLSQPLTSRYYEQIQDDTFHQYPYEVARHGFTTRGDALTDARYLEALVPSDEREGELRIETGS